MAENSLFKKFSKEKQGQIIELLNMPVLARLATANLETCQPHVVPLWFYWDGMNIWISGFGNTRKFKDLITNPRCAILIEPANPVENKLQAVLLKGEAEVITHSREVIKQKSTQIYLRYLGKNGVQEEEPQSWIHDPKNVVARMKVVKVSAW